MKITFLGTGTSQGIPVVACKCDVCRSTDSRDKRLRTSVLINCNDKNLLVDCSPDFRYQMLRENVDSLRAILFTHEHRDHVAGLDDVRSFNWLSKAAVEIYAESRVVDCLKLMFSYAFKENNRYPGAPQINVNFIDENPFNIDDIHVIPIRGKHYFIPVLGFRIGDFSYITDFNEISDFELEKMRGSKIIVINALRHEKHISHFSLSEALLIIAQLKPERAYLTHIGHQMDLQSVEEKNLPKNVFFAYDGLSIIL